MRFFLVFVCFFWTGCESQVGLQAPQKILEPVPFRKTVNIEKAPDEELAPAFTRPANLKNAPSHAESSSTGLKSIQLKSGDEESQTPNLDSVVSVRFSGWTPDGKSFQKSKEDRPFKQRVGNLLKGWQEGIVKMKKGEVRRFWMPGKLAYDHDPNPNSQKGELIFDIELIEFKNKK